MHEAVALSWRSYERSSEFDNHRAGGDQLRTHRGGAWLAYSAGARSGGKSMFAIGALSSDALIPLLERLPRW